MTFDAGLELRSRDWIALALGLKKLPIVGFLVCRRTAIYSASSTHRQRCANKHNEASSFSSSIHFEGETFKQHQTLVRYPLTQRKISGHRPGERQIVLRGVHDEILTTAKKGDLHTPSYNPWCDPPALHPDSDILRSKNHRETPARPGFSETTHGSDLRSRCCSFRPSRFCQSPNTRASSNEFARI